MASAADVAFIHLHSACLYPVDILLADDAHRVLEINIDHEGVGPPLKALLPVFRRIQEAARPLLLWGHISQDDWKILKGELDPRGLSVQPIIAGPKDLRLFAKLVTDGIYGK